MLNKDQFVTLLNIIIAQLERNDEINEKVGNVLHDEFLYGITSSIIDSLIVFLEVEMGDKSSNPFLDSTISWWLYDSPNHGLNTSACKIYFPDNSEVNLYTPSDIYDYLLNKNNS